MADLDRYPEQMVRRVGRRSVVYALLVAAAVGICALSPSFGRAHPTANYRPQLGSAALDTGCYPLPEGVRFDFAFQVRSDGDIQTLEGSRRQLQIQYDEIDAAAARDEVRDAFVRAGFVPMGSAADLAFRKPGVGSVTAYVEPLPEVAPDAVVQGMIVLDLPTIAVQSDSAECSDPYVTKRFASSEEDGS